VADDFDQLEEAFGRRVIDSLGRVWNPDLHPRDRRGRFINVFKRIMAMPVGTSRSLNDVVDDAPNISVANIFRTQRGWEVRAMTRSGPVGFGTTVEQMTRDPHVIEDGLKGINNIDPFPDSPRCPHCGQPSPLGGYLPGHGVQEEDGFALADAADQNVPDDAPEGDPSPDDMPDVEERKEPKISFMQGIRNVIAAYRDPEFRQDRKDAVRAQMATDMPRGLRNNYRAYRGRREKVPRIPSNRVREAVVRAMQKDKAHFIYWDFRQEAFTVQDRLLYAGEDLNEKGDLVLRGTVDPEGNFKTWWFSRGEAFVRIPEEKGGEQRLLDELFSHRPKDLRSGDEFPRVGRARRYVDLVPQTVGQSATAENPKPPRDPKEVESELAKAQKRLEDVTNPVEGDERRALVRQIRELNDELGGDEVEEAPPEPSPTDMQRAIDEVQLRVNEPVGESPEAIRDRENDEVVLAALKAAVDNATDLVGLDAVRQEIANADEDKQEEVVSRLPRAVQDAIRFNAPSVAGPREDKRIAEIEDSLPDSAKEEFPRTEQELRRRSQQESRQVAKGIELALRNRPKGSASGLRGLFFDEPVDDDKERERQLKIEGLQASLEEARLAVVEAQKAVNALDKNAPKSRQDDVRGKLNKANSEYLTLQDRLRNAVHDGDLLAQTLPRTELKREFNNVPEEEQRKFVIDLRKEADDAQTDIRARYRRMYKAVTGQEPSEEDMKGSLRKMAQWIDRRDENGTLVNVKDADPDGFAEKFVRDAYAAEWKDVAAGIAEEAFVDQDVARREVEGAKKAAKGSRPGKARNSRTATNVWRNPNARRQMARAEQQEWRDSDEPVIIFEGPDGDLVVERAAHGNSGGIRATKDGFFVAVDLAARLGDDWRERYPGVSRPVQFFQKDGNSDRWLPITPGAERRLRQANEEDIALAKADIQLDAAEVADAVDALGGRVMSRKLPPVNLRELSGEDLRLGLRQILDEMDDRYRELDEQNADYTKADSERIAYAKIERLLAEFEYVDAMERREWVVEVQRGDAERFRQERLEATGEEPSAEEMKAIRGQTFQVVSDEKDAQGRLRTAKGFLRATRRGEFMDMAGAEEAARRIAAANDEKILKDRGADPTAGINPLGDGDEDIEDVDSLYNLTTIVNLRDQLVVENANLIDIYNDVDVLDEDLPDGEVPAKYTREDGILRGPLKNIIERQKQRIAELFRREEIIRNRGGDADESRRDLLNRVEEDSEEIAAEIDELVKEANNLIDQLEDPNVEERYKIEGQLQAVRKRLSQLGENAGLDIEFSDGSEDPDIEENLKYADEIPELQVFDFGRVQKALQQPLPPNVVFDARIAPPGGMRDDLGDAMLGAFAAHAALPESKKKEFFVYRTPDGQFFYSDIHPYYYDQIRGGEQREEIEARLGELQKELDDSPILDIPKIEKEARKEAGGEIERAERAAKATGKSQYLYRDSNGKFLLRSESIDDDSLVFVGKTDEDGKFELEEPKRIRKNFTRLSLEKNKLEAERDDMLSERARVLMMVDNDHRAVVYGLSNATRRANAVIINEAGALNREERKREVIAELRDNVPGNIRMFDVQLENWVPREFLTDNAPEREPIRNAIGQAKRLIDDKDKYPVEREIKADSKGKPIPGAFKAREVQVYRNEDGSFEVVAGQVDPSRQRVARIWDPMNDRGPQIQWIDKRQQEMHDAEMDPRSIVPSHGGMHTRPGGNQPGFSANPAEDIELHEKQIEDLRKRMGNVGKEYPPAVRERRKAELAKSIRHHADMIELIEKVAGDRDQFESDRKRFEREHAISSQIRDVVKQAMDRQKESKKTVQIYLNDDGGLEISTERYDPERNRIARITPGGKSGKPALHWEKDEYKDIYDDAQFSLETLLKQYFDVEQVTDGLDFRGKFVVRNFADAVNNDAPGNIRDFDHPVYSIRKQGNGEWKLMVAAEGEGFKVDFGNFATPEQAARVLLNVEREAVALSGNRAFKLPEDDDHAAWFVQDNRLYARPLAEGFNGNFAITRRVFLDKDGKQQADWLVARHGQGLGFHGVEISAHKNIEDAKADIDNRIRNGFVPNTNISWSMDGDRMVGNAEYDGEMVEYEITRDENGVYVFRDKGYETPEQAQAVAEAAEYGRRRFVDGLNNSEVPAEIVNPPVPEFETVAPDRPFLISARVLARSKPNVDVPATRPAGITEMMKTAPTKTRKSGSTRQSRSGAEGNPEKARLGMKQGVGQNDIIPEGTDEFLEAMKGANWYDLQELLEGRREGITTVFWDIETTSNGAFPGNDGPLALPIQISGVAMRDGKPVGEPFTLWMNPNQKVGKWSAGKDKPGQGVPLSEKDQKKYGSQFVTDDFIKDQLPFAEQMPKFLNWLAGLGPTAMVAQNGQGMEIPLVKLLQEQGFLERGLPDNVVGHIDTMGILREATADLDKADVPVSGNNQRSFAQQMWAKQLNLDDPNSAHDAEADAKTMMAIMDVVIGGAVNRGVGAPVELSPENMSIKRRIQELVQGDEEITPEAVQESLAPLSVGDMLAGRKIKAVVQVNGQTQYELEDENAPDVTPDETSTPDVPDEAPSPDETQTPEEVDERGFTVVTLETPDRPDEPVSGRASVDVEKLLRDFERIQKEKDEAEAEDPPNWAKAEELQVELDKITNKMMSPTANQEKRGEGDLAPGEGVGRVGGKFRMEIPDENSPDVAQQAIENAEGSSPLNDAENEGAEPEQSADPDGLWASSAAMDAEDRSELVDDSDDMGGFPMLGAMSGDARAALDRSPIMAARIDMLDEIANADLSGFNGVDKSALNGRIRDLLENGRYGDEVNLDDVLNYNNFYDVKGAVLRKENGYVSLTLTRANGTKVTEYTKQRPSNNGYYPWLQRAVAYHGNAEIPRGLSYSELPDVVEDIERGSGVDGPAAHFLADIGFKVREALNRRMGLAPSPNEPDGFIALRRDRPDLPGFTNVDSDGIPHISMHASALRDGPDKMHPVEIALHEQLHGVSEAIHNPREVIKEGLLGYEEGLVQAYTQHLLSNVGESVGFEGLKPSKDNPYWPWSEAYEKIRNTLGMSPDYFYGGLLKMHPRDRQKKMREWADTEVVNTRLRERAKEAIDEADVILRSMDLRAVAELERANPDRPQPVLSPNARNMPGSPLPSNKPKRGDWSRETNDPVEQFWREVADEAVAERERKFNADIEAGRRPEPVVRPENPIIPGEDPSRRARRQAALDRWAPQWGPGSGKDGFAMAADLPEYPENRHFANSGDMAKHVILSELLGDDGVMRFMEAVPWANNYGPERFGSRARTRDDVWDFRSHAVGNSILSDSAYNRALNDVIGTEDKPAVFPGSGMLADMLLPRSSAIISPPHDTDGYGLEWAYASAGKGDFVLIDPMLPRQRSGKRKLHAFDVFQETTRREAKSMLWTAMLENDSEGERLREEAEQAGDTWTAEIKFKQAVSGMNGMHIVVSNANPQEMDRLDAAMREYIKGFSNGDLNLRRHKKKPDVDVSDLTNPADVPTASLSERDREVVDHIQALHRGLDPDDPGFGDINMTSLAKREGKDGTPDVIDDADIDGHVADGEVEVWRGVSKAQWADQFESGEYAAGLGPVVNGYYTSTRAGTAANHMSLPSSDQGTPEDIAKREGVMQRMTIKKDARVLELSDYDSSRLAESDPELLRFYDNVRSVQKTRLRLLTRELDEWRGANPPPSDPEKLREYIDEFWEFANSREKDYKLSDLATITSMDTPHIFGLLHGYDAVYFRAPNPGKPAYNWVILNRAATRISKTRYTSPEPVSEIRKHKDDIKVAPIE